MKISYEKWCYIGSNLGFIVNEDDPDTYLEYLADIMRDLINPEIFAYITYKGNLHFISTKRKKQRDLYYIRNQIKFIFDKDEYNNLLGMDKITRQLYYELKED